MCWGCGGYGLKKHGITRSDRIMHLLGLHLVFPLWISLTLDPQHKELPKLSLRSLIGWISIS